MSIVDKYSQQMKDQDYIHLCNSLMSVYQTRTTSGELQKLNNQINALKFLLTRAKHYPSVTDELRVQALYAFCTQIGIQYHVEISPGEVGILPSEIDGFYEAYRKYNNTTSKIMVRRINAELMDLQDMRDRIYSYM